MICLECEASFESLKGLHLHISKSHFSLPEYYHKNHPRYDFYSKELIVFKDLEDYSDRDFNSKESFANWCVTADPDTVKEYILQAFGRRLKKKNTEYIPSHLELKSLFLPSWFGITSIFKNKSDAVEALSSKFKLKYDYLSKPVFSEEECEILIDTREQYPLHFPNSKRQKLSCGDYTSTGSLYSDVFVERKSLPDLVSTLSGGKDRFVQEIERAKKLNYYLVVVIEDEFTEAFNWSPNSSFSRVANGKYIFYTIRDILAKYDNIQFLFSDSRKNSTRIIEKIFKMKDQVKNYDLEFLKDFNML
jgi:ERCC4-type nuclease